MSLLDLTVPPRVPKIIVGSPTYGAAQDAYVETIMRIMASFDGRAVKLLYVPCNGSNIAENQNVLAGKVEETGADYLLLVETDMGVYRAEQALPRLLAHNKDIAGATYMFKDARVLSRLLAGESVEPRFMGHKLGGAPVTYADLAANDLIAMDFIPMGLTLISANALYKVRDALRTTLAPPAGMEHKKPPFFYHGVSYPEESERAVVATTDSTFCATARQAGLEIWCDGPLSLMCTHVGTANYGLQPVEVA